MKRFVSIWFMHLKTDWKARHDHQLKNKAFVMAYSHHGRMCITEASAAAKAQGIEAGMVVADAKVLLPSLIVLDDDPQLCAKLLKKLALWAIRFTPVTAVDLPDGLILDVTGCAHLWNGEAPYLGDIVSKLQGLGYHIRIAMADTIGTAWAVARFSNNGSIIAPDQQKEALLSMPPEALRLEKHIAERLHKLGLHSIKSFIHMESRALRRRFGPPVVERLRQALGQCEEPVIPLLPPQLYEERMPCAEAISTRKGIEIALENLLETLCSRLQKDGKGVRAATLKGFRTDGQIAEMSIATNRTSVNRQHLQKLFEIKLEQFEPSGGIELFMLIASEVQDLLPVQQSLWTAASSIRSNEVSQLFDYIQGKFGKDAVRRYLPAEHHMPERSVAATTSLAEEPAIAWRTDRRRPVTLLQRPVKILVSAPVPDYPPMNFNFRGKLHTIKKADGPERIEPEWWLETGLHRDYYVVEDEEGRRYWVFRLGHYGTGNSPEWYMHGFFG